MPETTITTPKRPREEETLTQEVEEMKRQKTASSSSTSSSYNQILSILETEEEEDEHVEDVSSLITSLQQEISTSDLSIRETTTTSLSDHNSNKDSSSGFEDSSSSSSSNGDEEDKERVIRHLLEASDDELGIPQVGLDFEFEDGDVRSGNGDDGLFYMGYDGLWEFEDEAANYYTLLQSELFM